MCVIFGALILCFCLHTHCSYSFSDHSDSFCIDSYDRLLSNLFINSDEVFFVEFVIRGAYDSAL